MIRLTQAQEQAFGRIVKASALDDLIGVFKAEIERARPEYDRASTALVVTGQGRDIALRLHARLGLLGEVCEMLERQKA